MASMSVSRGLTKDDRWNGQVPLKFNRPGDRQLRCGGAAEGGLNVSAFSSDLHRPAIPCSVHRDYVEFIPPGGTTAFETEEGAMPVRTLAGRRRVCGVCVVAELPEQSRTVKGAGSSVAALGDADERDFGGVW